MVLVFAIMGCMSTKTLPPAQATTAVATVITLESPEDRERLAPPHAVVESLRTGFSKNGLSLQPIGTKPPFSQLGTRHHRTEWLLDQTDGSLAVMIETEARQRSQLGGRFQWEVTATITVVSKESGVLVEQLRLPTTLPHIHQSEQDALVAIGARLAEKTAVLIQRHQRSGT